MLYIFVHKFYMFIEQGILQENTQVFILEYLSVKNTAVNLRYPYITESKLRLISDNEFNKF